MRNEAQRLRVRLLIATGACLLLVPGCVSNSDRQTYDVIIRGGMVYDGSGSSPRSADVALVADRIAKVGDLEGTRGDVEIDATGLAVAPGFINMMSHTWETLIEDGRAQSVIRQGGHHGSVRGGLVDRPPQRHAEEAGRRGPDRYPLRCFLDQLWRRNGVSRAARDCSQRRGFRGLRPGRGPSEKQDLHGPVRRHPLEDCQGALRGRQAVHEDFRGQPGPAKQPGSDQCRSGFDDP